MEKTEITFRNRAGVEPDLSKTVGSYYLHQATGLIYVLKDILGQYSLICLSTRFESYSGLHPNVKDVFEGVESQFKKVKKVEILFELS